MNTTNLFVELIVIGVGAIIWILILALAVMGDAALTIDIEIWKLMVIPLVAVAYLLGIITDRVSDNITRHLWSHKLRDAYFSSQQDYFEARVAIYTESEKLTELLEYGRSRLRICRGWIFNGVAIAVSLLVFEKLWPHDVTRLVFFFFTVALTIAFLSCYSWVKLKHTEYRKVKQQLQFTRAPVSS